MKDTIVFTLGFFLGAASIGISWYISKKKRDAEDAMGPGSELPWYW